MLFRSMVIELEKVGLPLEVEKPVDMVVVAGDTDADRDTACVLPLSRPTVTEGAVVPAPCVTDALGGLTLKEKSKVLAWAMVSVKDVERVKPPPLPVMVIV